MQPQRWCTENSGLAGKMQIAIWCFSLFLVGAFPRAGYCFWPFSLFSSDKAVLEQINPAEELDAKVKVMARELYGNLADQDPDAGAMADGIAITAFVDLKKLYRTSSFGRYLSEQLLSEFQKLGYNVVEIRKTSSILVQPEKGEFSLSREPEEINATIAAGTVLTGTYTVSDNYIIVNARILENENGYLLSSATVIFPRSSFSNQLLADVSSASTHKGSNEGVIYMKRLSL